MGTDSGHGIGHAWSFRSGAGGVTPVGGSHIAMAALRPMTWHRGAGVGNVRWAARPRRVFGNEGIDQRDELTHERDGVMCRHAWMGAEMGVWSWADICGPRG
ncbi:hypothetical protein GCM10010112_87120 [Actinoplanes lobatus]|uniref:Uncharacterized protein n=1 Tax=Actinoplanes lobatus TaxID=113568 RepID=A0ABQ4AVW5_9ACTN|nr:hypothetical protein GCM10010112_87120 [Actinoplanes lobatus]GIE45176.1 hypothetical protein Alo02nite_80740 [Actinoplanes lobatus]